VRLNDCDLPKKIASKTQYVDIFPDWDNGMATLVEAMWHQIMDKTKKVKLVS